jgi:superfamily I DNA/RNA helicase
MLQGIIKTLREAGIPFYNPYRTKNGAWNPLRHGSMERLLAFADQVPRKYKEDGEFEQVIDAKQLLSWYEIIKAQGNIPRGKKGAYEENLQRMIAESEDAYPSTLQVLFAEESGIWEYFNKPDTLLPAVDWFIKNIAADKSKTLAYPVDIIKKQGLAALQEKPKVIVGTIHSVKGGEADVVYVAPDLSYAGYIEANQSIAGRDAIARLKYVAYTRARESLVLLDAATNYVM